MSGYIGKNVQVASITSSEEGRALLEAGDTAEQRALLQVDSVEHAVDSMVDLLAMDVTLGKSVRVLNYHADVQGGGGVFYWDPTGSKAEHNGGTVIDPDVVFPTNWSLTAEQETWFTAGTGTGVWVRQYDGAVNVKWFGAKGDGVTDDTDVFQIALDYCIANRKECFLPSGDYYVDKTNGTIQLPYDDGSGSTPAYDASTDVDIAPEVPEYFYKCIDVNVTDYYIPLKIKGEGRDKTTILGSGALSYKAIFSFGDGATGINAGVEIIDVGFRNCFMPICGMNALFVESIFENLRFNNCGFAMYSAQLERCKFSNILMITNYAGLVNGGQWRSRCDNYNEGGGWADKNTYNKIDSNSWVSSTDMLEIDTWFDDKIFKSINNTTRKYPTLGSGTPATVNPYHGVCSQSIVLLSRYGRPCVSNNIKQVNHSYARRQAIRLSSGASTTINQIYTEYTGYSDNSIAQAFLDPFFNNNRIDNSIYFGTNSGSAITINGIEIQVSISDKVFPTGYVSYSNTKNSGCDYLTTTLDENILVTNANITDIDCSNGLTVQEAITGKSITTSNDSVIADGNFISVKGANATPISTGINVNAGYYGATCLVLASRHFGAGTSTNSSIYMLEFPYDGGTVPVATLVAGLDIIEFTVVGDILFVNNTISSAYYLKFISNKLL